MTTFADGVRRVWRTFRENGVWLTAVLVIAMFFGLVAFADMAAVIDALSEFGLPRFGFLLALSTAAYLVRYGKWEFYLRRLDADVSGRLSAIAFFSGLMMVVTPGKAGELWKAWFLRNHADVPVEKTSSVVAAERVTDVVALSAFALLGFVVYSRSVTVVFVVVALIALAIGVLQWKRFCLAVVDALSSVPFVGRYTDEIRGFYEETYELFQAWPLFVSVSLSLVAWGLEGVSLFVVLASLGLDASVLSSLFVFGLGSVVGAVSMLPGGLAAAEASMIGLLLEFGYPRTVVVAATVLVRVATLWYAAALGTVVFLAYKSLR